MCSTVDNVHHRNRHSVSVASADIAIEWHVQCFSGSLCRCQRYAEDGVGTEVALCRGTVELKHLHVDSTLIEHAITFERGSDDVVDIVNSLLNALSAVTALVTVAKFECFVLTGRCSRRNSRTAHNTIVEGHFNLYSRISS